MDARQPVRLKSDRLNGRMRSHYSTRQLHGAEFILGSTPRALTSQSDMSIRCPKNSLRILYEGDHFLVPQ